MFRSSPAAMALRGASVNSIRDSRIIPTTTCAPEQNAFADYQNGNRSTPVNYVEALGDRGTLFLLAEEYVPLSEFIGLGFSRSTLSSFWMFFLFLPNISRKSQPDA